MRPPTSRSPSQCPGTARSSTVAGRSRIDTASTMCPPGCTPGSGAVDTTAGGGGDASRRFLEHAAALHKQTEIGSSRATRAWSDLRIRCRSQPAICCGLTTGTRAGSPRRLAAPGTWPSDSAWGADSISTPGGQPPRPDTGAGRRAAALRDSPSRRRAPTRVQWRAASARAPACRETSSRSGSVSARRERCRGGGGRPPAPATT